jgi:hypothetical protein
MVAVSFYMPEGWAATIPPGVPEPGLVVWGAVVNQTNNQPITITSVSWSVTDSSNSAIYSSVSIPATRILNVNGISFYILQVPFDTRQLGSVTLADPATVGINSFILRSSSPPTYTMVPTINGALATVRSIDGAPASGGTVPVAGFTSATRGRVIRVDLAIIPVGTDYDAWAAGYFGSASHPDAVRTADPDGDGMNNDREFASGTDPKNASSVLRVLTLTVHPTETVVGWLSVTNRNYLVERALSPDGPWNNASPVIPGSSPITERTVPAVGQGPEFYRVRVMAP